MITRAARKVLSSLALLCAVGLASCGDSGVTGGDLGGTGIDGSGFVYGPIEGFGSIIVQGITIDVSTATIALNGQLGSEEDLRLGMVVTVFGVFDLAARTGVAQSVIFESSVHGPVESLDLANSRFVALGQTVVVTDDTELDGGTLAALSPGDIVELSGLRNEANEIVATWIAFNSEERTFEVLGFVENLDVAEQTFYIVDLLVDYSDASMEDGPVSDGLLVEVGEAHLDDGVFVAGYVEIRTPGGDPDDLIEFQGIVTAVLARNRFIVDGRYVVNVNSATRFLDGAPSHIRVDTPVHVIGDLTPEGEFLATEIGIDEPVEESEDDEVELDGTITSLLDDSDFVVDDSTIVHVDEETTLVGGTLDDIVVDAPVRVWGVVDELGEVFALEIDFEELG